VVLSENAKAMADGSISAHDLLPTYITQLFVHLLNSLR
jgi:hypothetical protein